MDILYKKEFLNKFGGFVNVCTSGLGAIADCGCGKFFSIAPSHGVRPILSWKEQHKFLSLTVNFV